MEALILIGWAVTVCALFAWEITDDRHKQAVRIAVCTAPARALAWWWRVNDRPA